MKYIDASESHAPLSFSTGSLSRRSFLKGSATLGAGIVGAGLLADILAGCGPTSSQASSGTLTPVSVQLNWLENVEFGFSAWMSAMRRSSRS